ncbi:uncharacterized protein METZ01_LOCUS403364, partial [marine metagenome]
MVLLSACAAGGPGNRGYQDVRMASSEDMQLTAKDLAAVHYLKGLVAHDRGDIARATGEMSRAVALDPDDPRPHAHLVQLHIRAGSLESALSETRELVRLEPEDIEHRVLLASLYVSLDRHDSAIEEYVNVLARSPNREDALVQLGS